MRKAILAPLIVAAGVLFAGLVLGQDESGGHAVQYPITKTVDQVDDYNGVKVADPYRWLEDENSPDTARWVQEENAVTFDYFRNIPFRAKLTERLEALYSHPRYSQPFGAGEIFYLKGQEEVRRGDSYFSSKNDGLRNQSIIYVQHGLDRPPEVVLDPNKFSSDGTTRLGWFSLSRNGKYAAFTLSKGGSDWQEVRVMDVASGKILDDKLEWIKFAAGSWAGDGFFYSRYDEPEKGKEHSFKNENQKVYFHRVGTSQTDDELAYEDKANPLRFHVADTTEDERFAILYIADRSKGLTGQAIYYRDLSAGQKAFKPLLPDVTNDEFRVVDNVGDKFLVQTNRGAPNKRIVLIDPAHPEDSNWKTVVAERPERLQFAESSGGKLFVGYVKDVCSRVYVYSLQGKIENEVILPGLGSADGFAGQKDDKTVFYTFSSFTYPASLFSYNIATRKSTLCHSADIQGFRPDDYETKQVFFNSKDGARVPMFLVYKKGIKLDSNNPAWMYAYGTYGVPLEPTFLAQRLALLEQGFIYVSVNVRGGGEYGEKWHQAGMKLQRQNTFDDFIAGAEWLIANKYTSPGKLAAYGAMVVGPAVIERPDLFRVAISVGAVLDMLRYQKFTIGWNWATDFGLSSNPEEFKALYAWSPLHNVRDGVKYPATLITTADHDDRVVPAHSFKFAATLQAKGARSPDSPLLIRIDTKSGAAASSTAKAIELTADIYSFMMYNMGVSPRYENVAAR